MTSHGNDQEAQQGITDDQLPEDLRPSEDNPLAAPLSEEDAPDDLADLEMDGGKTAQESADQPAGQSAGEAESDDEDEQGTDH